MAESVTWEQTRAFRLDRLHLSDPVGPRSFLRVARDLGGVHAQVHSAAEVQCALRAPGLAPGSLDRALWERRSLVKTWAMRGTLHYIDEADFPVWAAGLRTHRAWRRPVWLRTFKLTEEIVESAVEAVGDVLDGQCLTRAEIADAVHARLNNRTVDEFLRSGWGSILKIVATYGLLCFGPSSGRNVTFVRPDQWIERWWEHDTKDAMVEICRRYLRSHGPATREEFARWWGFLPPDATKVLDELGAEVVQVEREGDKAFVLKRDLRALRGAKEDDEVRLLGMFDAYTLAGLPHDQIVPKARKDKVYRKGAWVSQVVLRGGRVVGVWTHERKSKGTVVAVERFGKKAATKPEVDGALQPLIEHIGPIARLSVA